MWTGWVWIARNSSSVSLSGLSRMRFEIASLPMSCSRRRAAASAAVGVEAEHRGDPVGDLGDALRMAGGERRLGVDHPRERLGDPVEPGVVAGEREVGRLPLGDVGRLERGPEVTVVAEAQERVDQGGVEPAPAPAQRHRARGLQALGGVEDLDRLREAQDPGRQRDLLAAQTVGHAAPVPVLVEAADRGRGLLGEEQHPGDLGAAVAAGLHELACDLALVADALAAPRCGAAARCRAPPSAATTGTPRAGSSSRRASTSPWPRGRPRRTSTAMRLALAEQPASLSSSA